MKTTPLKSHSKYKYRIILQISKIVELKLTKKKENSPKAKNFPFTRNSFFVSKQGLLTPVDLQNNYR